jgi:hypothetical protein
MRYRYQCLLIKTAVHERDRMIAVCIVKNPSVFHGRRVKMSMVNSLAWG